MTDIDQYIHAATRDNTRQSYQSAVRHFEVEWTGFLPATPDSVARYLAHYAKSLAINTLKQRLAALAQWHIDQGFPDPTKAPVVRKVLRGIQALHPAQEKQAKPLQLEQLLQVVNWLDQQIRLAQSKDNINAKLRHARNKALLLLGFWKGFRGDELVRLQVEHINVVVGAGMTIFLQQTKNDQQLRGAIFKVPALSRLCPVTAYLDWIDLAMLERGPVFRHIDRWGNIGNNALHIDSLIPILRTVLSDAGVDASTLYSGHSLRRGFANWATSNGWDLKMLMDYVGWKSSHSAMRYIERVDPFFQQKIEMSLHRVADPIYSKIAE